MTLPSLPPPRRTYTAMATVVVLLLAVAVAVPLAFGRVPEPVDTATQQIDLGSSPPLGTPGAAGATPSAVPDAPTGPALAAAPGPGPTESSTAAALAPQAPAPAAGTSAVGSSPTTSTAPKLGCVA